MGIDKIKKYISVFIIFYILQLVLSSAIIYYSFTNQTKSSLTTLIERVKRDIKYDNGTWDLSEYSANPLIPDRFRLYVFSSDGFVIDRWRPISGFMDLLDFKQLLTYLTPATVETITNQTWRIYSYPIQNGNKNTIGVINIAIYNPDESKIEAIDLRLAEVANQIYSKISIENGVINVDRVSRRVIPFDVSFQVVDQYNHILIENGNINSMTNIPGFIDPSYVRREMQVNETRHIKNTNGGSTFLVETAQITDSDNNPVGVVIAASSLAVMYSLIKTYIFISSIAGIFFIAAFAVIIRFLAKESDNLAGKKSHLLKDEDVISISFSKEDCMLRINNISIELLYATNQFYMLDVLFSKPKKKWETDELLEKFGEDFQKNGWRKVYDAMLSINKKTSNVMEPKLIVTNNKTYQINPQLLDRIK